MALSFEKYDAEHQKLWDTMKIIRDADQLDRMAQKVIAHKAVYQKVEQETGVPWQLVAVIHIREAGLQDVGRFRGGIHNGQPWSQKTTIVPRGVGPFGSWHEAAVHALRMKEFHTIKKWTPAKMVSASEPYNGYGYRNRGLRSPYLWASTNHQQRGKYVSDGVFNANVMDTQMGVAAMLRFLGVGVTKTTTAPSTPHTKPVAKPTSKVGKVARDATVTSTITGGFAYYFQEYALPILIVGGIVVALIVAYRALKDD